MTYRFIIRGRNCEKYIEKCLKSVMAQTRSNWTADIILDDPEDSSVGVAGDLVYCKLNMHVWTRPYRHGLARNIYEFPMMPDVCHVYEDEDVLCFLDADDWLSVGALHYVDKAYASNPKCLLTHGSYVKVSKGRRTKVSNPYHGEDYRSSPWRGSHLKTVKWKLFKRLPEECMKHNGEWLEAASDLAIMIPLMEMAGAQRIEHVHELIYFWRDSTPQKTKRVLQKKCEAIIRAKPRMGKVQVL